MARTCSICSHPKRKDIEKAIALDNESIAKIAQDYAVSAFAITRHKTNHMEQKLTMLAEKVKTEICEKETGGIVGQLKSLQAKALQLMDDCLMDGDRKNAIGAMREARAMVELMSKLTGELDEGTKVQVNFIKHEYEVFGMEVTDGSGNKTKKVI